MAKTKPEFCDGCEHLYGALRTDFNPPTMEFFCGEPSWLELDSNEPGPRLGFMAVRHDECLSMGGKSVDSV